MLDHHHGIALIHQLVQHLQQLAGVLEMQAGGRLVEDIEGAACRPARQLLGQLDPLRLAARKGGRRLAHMHIAQADALEGLHLVAHRRHGLEKVGGLLDGHVQDVRDRLALEQDLQGFAVVALALADVAGDVDVGQEVHLDLDQPVALTSFAAPALDVEAEPSGAIAAGLGLRQLAEPVADGLEGARIGGRVGPGRAANGRLVDIDDLIEIFQALDPLVGRGRVRGVVQPASRGLIEGLDGEGGLAAAGHPGDAGEHAHRDLAGDVLQIVAPGADDLQQLLLVDGPALFRHRDFARPGQILAGQAFRVGHDVGWLALGDDLAAMNAGGRAHVDHMVGGENRLLVMFDHQHRIAQVAQALEADQQPVIVALVQADGGFVQHIEHAGQARADLRGQPDTLALAAGQGAGIARQVQIVQAHIHEEAQAVVDLLQDPPGDFHLLVRQGFFQTFEPIAGLADGQQRDLGHVFAGDLHRQGFGFQAIAVAGFAGRIGLITAQLLAHPGGIGLAPAPLQIGQHALEGLVDLIFASVVVIDEVDLLTAGAVQDHLAGLLGQLVPGDIHREVIMAGQGLQGLGVEGRRPLGPRRHRALVQALVLVRNDHVGVKGQLGPQTVADRAGAEGVVEREQPRLDLADGEAGHRTGELLGKQQPPRLLLVLFLNRPFGHGDTIGQAQSGLQRVRQPLFHVGLGDDAVDHHVDVVLELLVENGGVLDGVEFPVDLQALEARALPLGDLLAILALATAHHRRQQIEPCALGQGGDLVDHHTDGLAFDRQAGGRRIGHAHPRPQEPHIVVDLGHRAHGGARVAAGGLLLDGDGRRQAFDQVHVRLAHQLQELARIGR